jgi:hypothetical protein
MSKLLRYRTRRLEFPLPFLRSLSFWLPRLDAASIDCMRALSTAAPGSWSATRHLLLYYSPLRRTPTSHATHTAYLASTR